MYAKLFTQIFDSSIADNWQHRHVFEDLLKLSDQNGIVDMTPEAISARTRLPLEMVNDGLAALSKPDLRSRTKDEEGRRIVLLDPARSWGWRIVNYLKYRNMRNEFDRTSYMREYMRERRALNSVKAQFNNVKLSPSVYVLPLSGLQGEGGAGEEGVPLVQFEAFRAQICALYGRPESRPWNYLEQSGLAELVRRPEFEKELQAVSAFKATKPQFFPRSVESLITGWNKTLDQINAPSPSPNGVIKPPSIMDLKSAIQIKEEKAKALKDQHYTDGAVGGSWNNEPSRKAFITLRAEIKVLKERIEKMV